jgi:hypothetical protein
MDEDLLGCFLNGGGDLAFDELAAFEAGAGTDEGNEVGRVDGAPAGWAASISMKASLQRPGPVRRGLLRWLIPPCAMDTDTVLSSTSASLAPAGYRFPREVIAVAVRWYLHYNLSYRDVEELLAERGVEVDQVTVYRWVQTFTTELIDAP